MIAPVLVATHLLAFALGALTFWALIRNGDDMSQHSRRGLRTDLPLILTLTLITASLVLGGIGVQQYRYQRDRDRHDACIHKWGNDVIDSVRARSAANTTLAKATKRKDDAEDDVLLVVVGLRAQPPRKTLHDFDAALAAFAAAKAHLRHVTTATEATKASNPYPTLHCE